MAKPKKIEEPKIEPAADAVLQGGALADLLLARDKVLLLPKGHREIDLATIDILKSIDRAADLLKFVESIQKATKKA